MRANSAFTDSCFATSVGTVSTLPPSFDADAAVASRASARRPASTTEYPADCSARLTAFPMPLPAPVTTATLPLDAISLSFRLYPYASEAKTDHRAGLRSWKRVPLPETDLKTVVESFVAGAAQPAMLDPGEEPLLLVSDQWTVSEWNGRLILQAWDEHRNLVRKIVGLKERRRDRLRLITERFRKAEAEIEIADLAAPGGRDLERRASRVAFCERFRLMLAREWPDWQIVEVSADANLEASLSTSYARSLLRQGSVGMAVMAAPPKAPGAGIVAFGLIWLDHLRHREKALAIGRLLLYVPLGSEPDVAPRVACLDATKVSCRLFAFDARDRAGLIDLSDAGNIASTLPPCGPQRSIKARRKRPSFKLDPEAFLESQVRAYPESIDASLQSTPVYGQVPVFAGGDRGVIDLLGIDHTGRLVVIELKATADLQLPFQALDYWLRVRKHLEAGDFERLGYFAGHVISRERAAHTTWSLRRSNSTRRPRPCWKPSRR